MQRRDGPGREWEGGGRGREKEDAEGENKEMFGGMW
jgi:hypothetical protein